MNLECFLYTTEVIQGNSIISLILKEHFGFNVTHIMYKKYKS